MELARLVEAAGRVAFTTRKTEKVATIAELLAEASDRDAELVAFYLTGVLPQGRIGIGWRTIEAATVEGPAAGEPLTLTAVDRALGEIAAAKGPGSGGRRTVALRALLARAEPPGRQFLARLLLGELRHGALEGVVLDAVARAAGLPGSAVRQAAMFAGGIGNVARAALSEGAAGLGRFSLRLLHPVAPMLASPAEDVGAALERLGEAAFEYKVDGARLQVHRAGDEVRVFTRHHQDVTTRVGEVVEWARGLPFREIVLEGEAVALREDRRPHPFQVTMGRLGRTKDTAAARRALPLSAFFFDCLYLEGDGALVSLPYSERLERLERAVSPERQLPRLVTGRPEAAERFLVEALDAGHEGLMAKGLAAPYVAGQRGFHWLKLKSARTLDLVVLAAEWGSGRRQGWLSNLHLGARDAVSGQFVMLGKTFKGLTDAMLRWQTEALLGLETGRDRWGVEVRPELVVEIAFSDVQESPRYPAGLALRFARVKRYRTDKPAEEADTLATVREIFDRQRA